MVVVVVVVMINVRGGGRGGGGARRGGGRRDGRLAVVVVVAAVAVVVLIDNLLREKAGCPRRFFSASWTLCPSSSPAALQRQRTQDDLQRPWLKAPISNVHGWRLSNVHDWKLPLRTSMTENSQASLVENSKPFKSRCLKLLEISEVHERSEICRKAHE